MSRREIRLAAGVSQAKVAQATGRSLFAVRNYERGVSSDLSRAAFDFYYDKLFEQVRRERGE